MKNLGRIFIKACYPLKFLPEGILKNKIRVLILHLRHSLPINLVVNTGDVAIQVGTPSRNTMRRFSRAVGPLGKVLIIEADSENVNNLMSALTSLRWDNTLIINKGAWSKRTTLIFNRSPRKSDHKIPVPGIVMDNDLLPENRHYDEFQISTDKLDNIVKENNISKVDFISITVNGAELQVLYGAEELLRRWHPRVFSKGHARDCNGVPLNKKISAFLSDLQFETYITKGEPAVGNNPGWRIRDGDVYAYTNN